MNTDPHTGSIFALCDVIRETSFEIHKYLRSGHLEKIYENALAHRLRKKGFRVKQQDPLKVFDEDGTVLGLLKADLFVDNRLICEIKGPRWSLENRPYVVTSKPANGEWPGLEVFTLLSASCPIDFA